jgi:hypothetical protein
LLIFANRRGKLHEASPCAQPGRRDCHQLSRRGQLQGGGTSADATRGGIGF